MRVYPTTILKPKTNFPVDRMIFNCSPYRCLWKPNLVPHTKQLYLPLENTLFLKKNLPQLLPIAHTIRTSLSQCWSIPPHRKFVNVFSQKILVTCHTKHQCLCITHRNTFFVVFIPTPLLQPNNNLNEIKDIGQSNSYPWKYLYIPVKKVSSYIFHHFGAT